MSPVVIQKPPLWQRLRPVWGGFDGWLALAVLILACMGLVVMYPVTVTTSPRCRKRMAGAGVAWVMAGLSRSMSRARNGLGVLVVAMVRRLVAG